MLESWENIGVQVTGVLAGFLIGSLEYTVFGWLGLISQMIFVGIWFPNMATYPNPITLLGIAEFAKDWSLPLVLIAYLKSPLSTQIRDHT